MKIHFYIMSKGKILLNSSDFHFVSLLRSEKINQIQFVSDDQTVSMLQKSELSGRVPLSSVDGQRVQTLYINVLR